MIRSYYKIHGVMIELSRYCGLNSFLNLSLNIIITKDKMETCSRTLNNQEMKSDSRMAKGHLETLKRREKWKNILLEIDFNSQSSSRIQKVRKTLV